MGRKKKKLALEAELPEEEVALEELSMDEVAPELLEKAEEAKEEVQREQLNPGEYLRDVHGTTWVAMKENGVTFDLYKL